VQGLSMIIKVQNGARGMTARPSSIGQRGRGWWEAHAGGALGVHDGHRLQRDEVSR
jgi:hypothetical protein